MSKCHIVGNLMQWLNNESYSYQKIVICLLTWGKFNKFTPVSKHCLIPLFSDAKYCSDLEGQTYPKCKHKYIE